MRHLTAIVLTSILILLLSGIAKARDPDGRYAHSPLKEWFDSLRSELGPCCSDADGASVVDDDWRSTGEGYEVRLRGKWQHVPSGAVLKGANRDGRTMVWTYEVGGELIIRCFMLGAMT